MTNETSETGLIVSPAANRVVVRRNDGALDFEALPRWLGGGLGVSASRPRVSVEETRHPLFELASVSADIIETRLPVRELLLELEGVDGPLTLLAEGRPVDDGEDTVALLQVYDVSEIMRDRRRSAAVGAYHGLVGRSIRMLEVYRRIALYGPTDAPVIITGETGTGKELVAAAIHERSKRQDGPFVAVNCTALTPELFESELFGHEKGSFTGAVRSHKGRFERAHGGTLFLDEIGDMPLMTQAKMLRALENGTIERVGGEIEQRVDVRVVAATNVAVERSVAEGRFRADLYHRLSVFRIHMPPLRERTGDMGLLVDFFIEHFNRRYNRTVKRLTAEALRILEEYHWPGNIRELRNVMERVFVESSGEVIGAKALSSWIAEREYLMPGAWNVDQMYAPRQPIIPQPPAGYPSPPPPQRERRALPAGESFAPWQTPAGDSLPPVTIPDDQIVFERPRPSEALRPERPSPEDVTPGMLRRAYREAGGNITGAARSLGMHKATFYRHMKSLGLEREDLEKFEEEAPEA